MRPNQSPDQSPVGSDFRTISLQISLQWDLTSGPPEGDVEDVALAAVVWSRMHYGVTHSASLHTMGNTGCGLRRHGGSGI